MAAEESSQGAALGPELSSPERDARLSDDDVPDLHDVLWELLRAICVVETISLALQELTEESPEPVGACAVALEHGVNLFNTVYERFDRGLVASDRTLHEEGSETAAEENDDDLVIEMAPAEASPPAEIAGDHTA